MNEVNLTKLTDNKSEAVVIDTLLFHPNFLSYCDNLLERDFSQMENMLFYWAVKQLYIKEKVTEITALNLERTMNSHAGINKEFQKYNIDSLQKFLDYASFGKTDDISAFKAEVKHIRFLSFQREVAKYCQNMANYIATNENVTAETLNGKLYKDLQDITTRFTTEDEIKTLGEVSDPIWEEIETRKASGEMNGFPSIFPSLKQYFIYQRKEMVLIGARMKTGKSIVGMLEAINAAEHGITTLVYDSEMSDKLYFLRVLSHYTGISAMRLENEALTPEEEQMVQNARERIRKLPIYHIFSPSMTLDQLYSVCYQYKVQNNLEFVIYDYIKGGDELESSTRSNAMGKMADFLKNKIGGELDLAVLAFAQIGRSGEMAESDALERYCSVSCHLFKKSNEQIVNDGADCGTMGICVKLNRLGRSMLSEDYIDLEWASRGLTMQEAKRHAGDDLPV